MSGMILLSLQMVSPRLSCLERVEMLTINKKTKLLNVQEKYPLHACNIINNSMEIICIMLKGPLHIENWAIS